MPHSTWALFTGFILCILYYHIHTIDSSYYVYWMHNDMKSQKWFSYFISGLILYYVCLYIMTSFAYQLLEKAIRKYNDRFTVISQMFLCKVVPVSYRIWSKWKEYTLNDNLCAEKYFKYVKKKSVLLWNRPHLICKN